jgi:hypothetical protein
MPKYFTIYLTINFIKIYMTNVEESMFEQNNICKYVSKIGDITYLTLYKYNILNYI